MTPTGTGARAELPGTLISQRLRAAIASSSRRPFIRLGVGGQAAGGDPPPGGIAMPRWIALAVAALVVVVAVVLVVRSRGGGEEQQPQAPLHPAETHRPPRAP